MTTQYTPTLKLALPVTGELSGTWGDVVNDNITSMIEQAIAGLSTINTWTANAHTLTTANGTTSESRCAMLVAATGGGAPTAVAEIICPAAAKLYVLQNNTSYAVTLKTSAGTGVAVAAGDTAFLFCDGTNVNSCVTTIVNGNITGNLTVGGNATINGNTTLGNATSDTITATARFASDLLPSTDNARDLGAAANAWKDLYIDGTATMALVAISGGTIDGVSIGATTAATLINVDNLRLDGNTISSTDTNGNVVIAPNGTGDVQLDADTVRVGDSAAAATLTSNGAGALTVTTGGAADLTLSTNGGTTSGTVVIANGVNGNITLTPDGTGDVILSADRVQMGDSNTDTTLTTNGTGSLNLTTNNGSNSGTIQIAQGINGNITLTPNGTGSVSISKLYSSGNTTLGATTANTLSVAALVDSNLLFTDATYDIGATGANRPRDLFLSRNLTVGGTLTLTGGVNLNGNVTVGDASTDTLTINSTITSNLIFTDNTYDIGASGATRPRNLYLAGLLTMGGALTVNGNTTLGDASTDIVTVNGTLGIGGAASASRAIYVQNSISGLNIIGTDLRGTYTSTGGSLVAALATGGGGGLVANSGGAISAYGCYFSEPNVTVTSGSVTNAATVFINEGPTEGGTLNANLYTNAATGTNKWNIYASGTAANYFAGNVGIGTAPSYALDLLTSTNGIVARFKSSSNYGTVVADNSTTTGGGSFSVRQNGTQYGAFAVDGAIQGNTSTDVAIFADSGSSIKFYTNGSATVKASISTAGLFTVAAGASIQGLTVGLGNTGASATSTAVGISALANSSGADATAFGYFAGENLSSGAFSIAIGSRAMGGTTGGPNTGSYNTAIGNSSLAQNTSGNRNIAIGNEALAANQTGECNVAVGSYQSAGGDAVLAVNTAGNNNTAVGAAALAKNTASNNTAVGYQAGYSNNSATQNVYVGPSSGYYNQTGTENTFVGFSANGNGTGGSAGSYNTAVGRAAMNNNYGSYNTAVGTGALQLNTSASNNTAVGYQAGYINQTGGDNTFLGKGAGYGSANGYNGNTAIGFGAGGLLGAGGNYNTFLGVGSGGAVTTGGGNVIIGAYSGAAAPISATGSGYIVLSDGAGNVRFYSDGSGNLFAGTSNISFSIPSTGGFSRFGSINATNVLQVAYNSTSSGVSLTSAATSWGTFSDQRLKNVTGVYENALADIAQIEPIKFTWKSDESNKPCVGVLAHTVKAVVPEAVEEVANSMEDETLYLQVRYTELIPLMIASIKELKAEVDSLKSQLNGA